MKTVQGKLAALAIALLILALLLPAQHVREDALILSPQEIRMSPGMRYTLKCYLRRADAGARVTFSSSDARVATVTEDGSVCALDSGETLITARTEDGARAQTRVLVEGVAVSELALNAEELRLTKGEVSGLRAIRSEEATDQRLKWVSEDENIARVDASGRVVGVGGGVTRVLVIAPNGKYAAAKVIVDVPAAALRVTPDSLTLGVGAKTTLQTAYLPSDSTDTVRSWISSDPRVLNVSADGEITALAPGTAHVSALTQGGLTAGMQVTVEEAAAEIALNPSAAVIERGDEAVLQLALTQPDGSVTGETTHPVEWESSAPDVAQVDQNGRVTGLKSGTCRVTAAVDGKTAACDLRVEVRVHEIIMDETEKYLLQEETDAPLQIEWRVDPQDADDPSIRFATDNDQVANVDQNGTITLTGGYGTAVITLTAASGVQAEYTVNVVTELPKEATFDDAEPDADFIGNTAAATPQPGDFFSVLEGDVPHEIVEAPQESDAEPSERRSVG